MGNIRERGHRDSTIRSKLLFLAFSIQYKIYFISYTHTLKKSHCSILNFRQVALSDRFSQQKHSPLSSMGKVIIFLSTVFKRLKLNFST